MPELDRRLFDFSNIVGSPTVERPHTLDSHSGHRVGTV